MVGRAGGHGASNPVGLPGTIHNPHNPPVQYTPATDTDIYKVSNENLTYRHNHKFPWDGQ